MNEMVAGDGSSLQLPPAFVMVNPRQHRKYKKGNDKVDGRTKGARSLFDRIQKRKMKEQVETQIDEAIVSDTERAQKSIAKTRNSIARKIFRRRERKRKRRCKTKREKWTLS